MKAIVGACKQITAVAFVFSKPEGDSGVNFLKTGEVFSGLQFLMLFEQKFVQTFGPNNQSHGAIIWRYSV